MLVKSTAQEIQEIHNANPQYAPAKAELEALLAAYPPLKPIPFACPLLGAYTDAIQDL